MAARSKNPGLQVPANATGQARQFYEAIKERLELLSGDRGDPSARAATRADLTAARTTTSTSSGTSSSSSSTRSTFDITTVPVVVLSQADGNLQFLLQGDTASDLFRVKVADLLATFTTADGENTLNDTWHFANEDVALDIISSMPRFRFIEIPLGDGIEDTLPVDSTIWDFVVDSGTMSLVARNDDDDTSAPFWNAKRTGDNPDYFDVVADELRFKGENVTAFRTYEADLGSLARYSGSFDISGLSGLTTNKPVHIWQAAVAYTGKGTLPDEAEMDAVHARGYVLSATTIRVYWSTDRANGPVKGKVAFSYRIGT